eukprot:TRINITY_DN2292_c0_g1_i1.p1 TRINITY_DN2292_c0_g1~~TRINITY_DN2292_c0_g1_i1.p1  ORF type:complete len:268 (+),score=64.00 TRINITY_DN2292_c0_g1_i1:292-1095(+)
MASFHWETYLEGKHMEIMKDRNPKLSFEGPSFPEVKRDPTSQLCLEKIPRGFAENKKEAQKRGIHAYYSRIQRYTLENIVVAAPGTSTDFVSIEFFPSSFTEGLSDQEELDKYMKDMKQKFFEKMGLWGHYSTVTLSSAATSQFTEKNTPFATVRLFGEIEEKTPAAVFAGKYLLVVKTAGGFWEVSWHGSEEDLEANKQMFYDLVRNVRIKSPSEVVASAAAVEAKPEQHKEEDLINMAVKKLRDMLNSHNHVLQSGSSSSKGGKQ